MILELLLAASASAASLPSKTPPAVAGNPCDSGTAGLFPDLAYHAGSLWCAVEVQVGAGRELKIVKMDKTLKVEQSWSLPVPGGIAFPRLGEGAGALWLAYRAGSTAMLMKVPNGAPVALGEAGGNDPVAVGAGHVAWQSADRSFTINIRSLSDGTTRKLGPGRPTGLSRLLSASKVTLVDDDRTAVPGGTRPCWAGGYAVVEGPDGGNIAVAPDGKRLLLWPGAIAYTPKCAMTPWGFAVANWGGNSVRAAIVTSADFSGAGTTPPPSAPPTTPTQTTNPHGRGFTTTATSAQLSWSHPSQNGSISSHERIGGTASDPAGVARVEILVNLQKVGEATLDGNVFSYDLDASAYHGAINLSAVLVNKNGQAVRDTVRASVENGGGE